MAHAAEACPSTSQFFTGRTPTDQPTENCSSMFSGIRDFIKSLDCEQLEEFFYIDETVRWISNNNYKRVALQLPDHFLARAYRIATLIESKADTKAFILADTSYRSCCVDEVAASHASCDAIVHYGDACLSALTENIPVKFVFGSFPIDLEAFSQFPKCLATDVTTPLLLLTDACYSDKSDVLFNTLQHDLPKERQLYYARVLDPSQRDLRLKEGVVC
uniref:2-(3-amino-3-carboxypropyl)histidine synthase subunit 2 n=1 Tax=Angiostrongylus cantonensis TaxID=6313 RepID=A0A0K0D066_ANGCA